jgi:hypothetical protein
MASSVSVANKNKADIRDGNEYKIRKWLVLKFHGSGHGQKERVCLIIDKCRRQKLCKRAQKISAAAPLRVMASRYYSVTPVIHGITMIVNNFPCPT